MNKNAFLGAAAALTLVASGAFGATHTVLWDQNANFGGNVNSQNFGSGMTQYNDAGADDFAVPAGEKWIITRVDVTGVYFNGSGPATSEDVTFYGNKDGKPGHIKRGPFTVHCADNDGSFQCVLPKGAVRLPSGTWWVSVVANCDFQTCGEWNWTENTKIQGYEAVWENPGGSGPCTKWEPLHVCGGSSADLAFDLIGKAVKTN